MKVLFAVSNENITTSVISKYQQKYKEIVTSKNVYYFNAIIKELQNDKSYDAIVIGEDLEPISNNNYDVIDKFIIEKLDRISDEASKSTGEDISIIFICSDRRTKSDQLLRNLFSMGIYNALVGNDRSLDNVCSLIKKPRNKKEAKKYYMIDDDNSIEYEPANEELVSEEQLKNILNYYKKIGNDEKKCVQAFESISKQYNNTQLRLIIKILPIEIKAILETRSPIYQKLMENGTVLSNGKYSSYIQNKPRQPGKLDFIEKNISTNKLTQPVVIPSNINFSNAKQGIQTNNNVGGGYDTNVQPRYANNINNEKTLQQSNHQNMLPPRQQYNLNNNPYNNINHQQNYYQGNTQYQSRYGTIPPYNPYNPYNSYNPNNPYLEYNNKLNEIQNVNLQSTSMPTTNVSIEKQKNNTINNNNNKNIQEKQNLPNSQSTQKEQSANVNNERSEDIVSSSLGDNIKNETATPVKKKRGRPKKNVEEENNNTSNTVIKRKRGRPRKVEKIESINNDNGTIQNTVENIDNNNNKKIETNNGNNGVDLFNLSIDVPEKKIDNQIAEEDKYAFLDSNHNSNFNKKENNNFNNDINNVININRQFNNKVNDNINNNFISNISDDIDKKVNNNAALIKDNENIVKNDNNNFVIAGNGKIVSFVGASKNGTSFIVNCLAFLLADEGIKVAIVDFTKNKNSYYLFTDNDSDKVKIVADSMKKLSDGIVDGLEIKKNLSIFSSVPDENIDERLNKTKILNILSQNFDIVMLDCDLQSDVSYFTNSDEIYLVQSMDVFTIQPLTKFLSDYKNVIDVKKLHIVINKYLKLKKLDFKMVIAGMSKYNDPSMALQRDLFNPQKITYNLIPFDIKTYSSYLEAIALCKININEFSDNVMDSFYELKSRVYPLIDQQGENRKMPFNNGTVNSKRINNNFEKNASYDTNINKNNDRKINTVGQNYNTNKYLNKGQNLKSNNNLNNSTFSSDINSTLNKMRNNNF